MDAFGRRKTTELEEQQHPLKERRKNAYEKHFEDYVTRRVLRPDGRTVTERIYVGVYYRQAISDRYWKGIKVLYLLLFLAGAGLFALEAVRPVPSNTMKHCAAVQLVCIVLLIRLLFLIVVYITAPRRLTIGEYKYSVKPLKRAAWQTCIAMAALIPAVLLSVFIKRDGRELLSVVLALLAAGAIYLLFRIENGIAVETETNPAA